MIKEIQHKIVEVVDMEILMSLTLVRHAVTHLPHIKFSVLGMWFLTMVFHMFAVDRGTCHILPRGRILFANHF